MESNTIKKPQKDVNSKMLLKRTNKWENVIPPQLSSSVSHDQNGQEKNCPMESSDCSKVTAEVTNLR